MIPHCLPRVPWGQPVSVIAAGRLPRPPGALCLLSGALGPMVPVAVGDLVHSSPISTNSPIPPRAIEKLGGATKGKANIVLNPAEPPLMMRVSPWGASTSAVASSRYLFWMGNADRSDPSVALTAAPRKKPKASPLPAALLPSPPSGWRWQTKLKSRSEKGLPPR